MTRSEILQGLSHERDRLRALGVRRLSLFGSAARGEETSWKTFRSYLGGGRASAVLPSKPMARDAVVRSIEVIGEAVKRLPPDLTSRHPEVDWNGCARLRDVLAHQYSRRPAPSPRAAVGGPAGAGPRRARHRPRNDEAAIREQGQQDRRFE